jgi:hypothetical protein
MSKKKEEERRSVLESIGDFVSGAANDFAIGVGLKDDPYNPTPRDDMSGRISPYQARTEATVKRNAKNAAYYADNNNSSLAQSNRNIAAARRSAAMSSAAAPSLPNPDAVGEAEQALLDANKKGRSSTIATSAAGLLAGEDSTRKKRSLMGGLIR